MSLDALGGRRFILAMVTLFVCAFLLGFKLLADGSFTAIILATIGAYIGAGTFQHHSQIQADAKKSIGNQLESPA